jgi:hypothetical protein
MEHVFALSIDLCAQRKPGVVQAIEDRPIKYRIQRYEREPWTSPIRPARSEWRFTVIGRIVVILPGVPGRQVRQNFRKKSRSEGGVDLLTAHKDFEIGSHGDCVEA